MAFETARSMPGSQQDSYQGSTIWSCEKATLRRRIPRSLHRQSNIFEDLSPPTTKTTQRSQQRHSSLLIQPHQWLDRPLHQCLGPWRRQQRNVINLLSLPPLPPSTQRSSSPLSCSTSPGFPPQYPTKLRGFFTNYTLQIFWFSSSVSHQIRRFFIDRSCIFFIVPLGLEA